MEIDINISNYEEYLLSAVDGELNNAETAALETFLSAYPHLRQELADLQATRLTPDPSLTFGSKMQLYRQATPTVQNYEEALLDYVDNELHGAEKTALEQLVLQHPQIRQELALLQATRLVPDLHLQFPDKSSLYKHRRRTIQPVWWWSAAAAIVAGVMIWVLPQTVEHHPSAASVAQQEHTLVHNQPGINVTANLQDTTKGLAQNVSTGENKHTNTNRNLTQSVPHTLAQNTARNVPSAKRPATGSNQQNNSNDTPPPLSDRNRANAMAALNNVPQPENTSNEIVKQSQQEQQQTELSTSAINDKTTVMAKASDEKISNIAIPAAKPAIVPATVKGELVVSVTMNGESKLLNGVANVARFFAKKKKNN